MVENLDGQQGGREEGALARYVEIIRAEVEALAEVLPEALERQWSPSPVPKPREDTTERGSGGSRPDPTGDAVLDARRMKVRHTVKEAEALLRQTAIRARGVRLGVERAVSAWDGEAS